MAADGTYAAAYAVARSLVGYRPKGPNTDDNKISRWYGVVTAWCAETMSYVLAAAQVPGAFRSTRATLFAQHYASIGRAGRTPRVGALACFDWEHDGLYDHIGLVVGVDPDGQHITTIEGNTTPGGPIGVYAMRRSVSLVKLFCYPQYNPAPPVAHAAARAPIGTHFRPYTGDFTKLDWRAPVAAWQQLHPGAKWLSQGGADLLRHPAETMPLIREHDGGRTGLGQYVELLSDLMRAVQHSHGEPVTIDRTTEMTAELWQALTQWKALHNITPWSSLDHSDVVGWSTWAALTAQSPA